MFSSASDIVQYVQHQLSNYAYTFLGIENVSHTVSTSCPLTVCLCQPGAVKALVMCLRPYQNKQIITIIRSMYFTATRATPSFANRFQYLFPTHEGSTEGEIKYEVPVPMVALVATAVSPDPYCAQPTE